MLASIQCAVIAFMISVRRQIFAVPTHVTSCNSYLFMLDLTVYFILYHVLFLVALCSQFAYLSVDLLIISKVYVYYAVCIYKTKGVCLPSFLKKMVASFDSANKLNKKRTFIP